MEEQVAALTAEIVALKKQHEVDIVTLKRQHEIKIKQAVENQKEDDALFYYCDRKLTEDMYEDHEDMVGLLSEQLRETKERLEAVETCVAMNSDGDSLPHLLNLKLQLDKRDSTIRDHEQTIDKLRDRIKELRTPRDEYEEYYPYGH